MQITHYRATLSLGILLLSGLACTANAQYYSFFPVSTTIDYPVTSEVSIVGYANLADYNGNPRKNPTSPIINVIDNGGIGTYMYTYNSSTVNLNANNPYGSLTAYNNSTVNFNTGNVGSFTAYDASTFNITNGNITQGLLAGDHSIINFMGGNLSNNLSVGGNSITNFSNGKIYGVSTGGNSVFNMGGGSISNAIIALNGTVNIKQGSISRGILAYDDTVVNLYGGNIGGYLSIADISLLNLFGTELHTTLLNPHFQNGFNYYYQYALSGRLADGTDLTGLDILVEDGSKAHFTLNSVPEPGSIALFLGIAVVSTTVLRKRRIL